MLADPRHELSPPPYAKAVQGRMNPTGIPVFYGAFAAAVAIAEVRPPVGGIVLVGAFRPLRPLRLLDLPRIGHRFTGSIFAPGYADRAARALFLRSFHRLIASPVQPQDEPIEYLPTQAVAEYVRNVLGFDGIAFHSTQTGSTEDDDLDAGAGGTVADTTQYSNVAIFADPVVDAVLDPWGPPAEPPVSATFPLSLDEASVHGEWVRKVAYESSWIDLSDERGFDVASDDAVDF
jgi:hypothetical protein